MEDGLRDYNGEILWPLTLAKADEKHAKKDINYSLYAHYTQYAFATGSLKKRAANVVVRKKIYTFAS